MTAEKPNLKRMDNVGIVVESLDEAKIGRAHV